MILRYNSVILNPMSKKIAISLPEELYERLEEERRERGQSRSLLIREAVGEYLAERERRARIESYVQGYRDVPETPEELAQVESLWRASREEIERAYPWEVTRSEDPDQAPGKR